MAFAQVQDGAWVEIDGAFTYTKDGEQYQSSVDAPWSTEELASFGIKTISESDTIPDGKRRAGFDLVDDAGAPKRVWTFEDIPPPPVPDTVTLSDWRVALIMMGRYDEVEAAVIAARNSGTIEGKIAWQRFEYANNVYREELLQMAPLFGFSEADVDASLIAASS